MRSAARGLFALALLVVLGGGALGVAMLAPVSPEGGREASFTVTPGETLREVAGNLGEIGVIRSALVFNLYTRARGAAGKLQAGPYRARSDEWAWDILDRLVRGDVADTALTVPEGLWLQEIAALAGPLVAGGADSFLAAARDPARWRPKGYPGDTLEGYLFPSTYRFAPGADPALLLVQMTETQDAIWAGEFAARADSAGLSRHDALTLASIVEAEARVAEERPRIAAVYRNRLRIGMPLQADPTVVYALGERRSRTLLDDLECPSPYNTYRVAGLPPGPIGNPGRDAIRAVLWPDTLCRDLYFVARGDGTHFFGETWEDHQANRRRARDGAAGGP